MEKDCLNELIKVEIYKSACNNVYMFLPLTLIKICNNLQFGKNEHENVEYAYKFTLFERSLRFANNRYCFFWPPKDDNRQFNIVE